MQSNINISKDARTFAEIWQNLSANDKSILRQRLMAGMDITRQTVDNWSKGKAPKYLDVKKRAAQIVSRTLGISCSWNTLF